MFQTSGSATLHCPKTSRSTDEPYKGIEKDESCMIALMYFH